MKNKTLVVAVVLVVIIGGIGIFLSRAGRTGDEGSGTSIYEEKPAHQHDLSDKVSVSGNDATHENRPLRAAATDFSMDFNELDIASEHLEQGVREADILATDLEHTMADGDEYYKSTMMDGLNPSPKLSLRLALDQAAADKLDEILSAHASSEIQRYADAERAELELMNQLLENDREGYVNFLAIQSMHANGEELTAEQEAYYQAFWEKLGRTSTWDAPWVTEHWHQNNEVMKALDDLLTPEQREELFCYIEEQDLRERDMQAYMRSSQLADTLGLNEEDRTALYEYLKQNPGADNTDISEHLSPELRELMPSD